MHSQRYSRGRSPYADVRMQLLRANSCGPVTLRSILWTAIFPRQQHVCRMTAGANVRFRLLLFELVLQQQPGTREWWQAGP